MTDATSSKEPVQDRAEDNAFFPSHYALDHFTSPISDLEAVTYPNAYTGARHKILVIGTDERYLPMQNGRLFSTGNHPIETLLPMYHLDKAGFTLEIATLSGNSVKLEWWAFPRKDEAVRSVHQKYKDKFSKPLKLSDVVAKDLGADTDYVAVFVPGGHGPLIALPQSRDVRDVLHWALANDKHVIALCHGPSALLAAKIGEDRNPFAGYKISLFPDTVDAQLPDIGYLPGALTWAMGKRLKADGLELVNTDIKGTVHTDRKLITGDSPLAANALGETAANALLEQYSSDRR